MYKKMADRVKKEMKKLEEAPSLESEDTCDFFDSDILSPEPEPEPEVQEEGVEEVVVDFQRIPERFTSLSAVNKAIARVVNTKCGLIFGIDYTISNIKQGQKTFGSRSLHHISDEINPYQEVICVLGETITQIEKQGLIHAFGFGDTTVKDKDIFPLKSEGECDDFVDVYETYTSKTPDVKLGGPTNFAPLILKAIKIVQLTRQFQILIIVADGQVVSEEATIDAIVKASNYPLSIVVIGVGDGPWEVMKDFEEKLPRRRFDNFQFVDFHKVKTTPRNPDTAIALAALMKVPDQFRAIKKYELLERL